MNLHPIPAYVESFSDGRWKRRLRTGDPESSFAGRGLTLRSGFQLLIEEKNHFDFKRSRPPTEWSVWRSLPRETWTRREINSVRNAAVLVLRPAEGNGSSVGTKVQKIQQYRLFYFNSMWTFAPALTEDEDELPRKTKCKWNEMWSSSLNIWSHSWFSAADENFSVRTALENTWRASWCWAMSCFVPSNSPKCMHGEKRFGHKRKWTQEVFQRQGSVKPVSK